MLLALASFRLPKHALPSIYLLRLVALIQSSSLTYFAVAPTSFPHGVSDYMAHMLMASLGLISLVPTLLGFTFYIFDFGLPRKLLLTLAMVLHLCLVVPLQYLVQACALHWYSLLFMPAFLSLSGPAAECHDDHRVLWLGHELGGAERGRARLHRPPADLCRGRRSGGHAGDARGAECSGQAQRAVTTGSIITVMKLSGFVPDGLLAAVTAAMLLAPATAAPGRPAGLRVAAPSQRVAYRLPHRSRSAHRNWSSSRHFDYHRGGAPAVRASLVAFHSGPGITLVLEPLSGLALGTRAFPPLGARVRLWRWGRPVAAARWNVGCTACRCVTRPHFSTAGGRIAGHQRARARRRTVPEESGAIGNPCPQPAGGQLAPGSSLRAGAARPARRIGSGQSGTWIGSSGLSSRADHNALVARRRAIPTPRSPRAVTARRETWRHLVEDTQRGIRGCLLGIVLLICVYTVRHYWFTLNRLIGTQRHPYIDVDTADWPEVTIFIAAHNEEAVIEHILEALLEVDYPPEKMLIMPVNDRSKDRTREIIDGFVARYPDRIRPFHRTEGKPGKAAALKDATALVNTEVMLVFDADYIPGKGLVKQLVAPFFDPEIGAIMGRVVPLNAGTNLLTRLLDLERSGGYQVDQQARMNMRLVPQYGGTVGGVRRSALDSIGGWLDDTLAEDTDLTYRLLLRGWKTAYQNRSECYEEVPETWPVRAKQISRWAKGHNQAMVRYALPLLRNPRVGMQERWDGLLLLGILRHGAGAAGRAGFFLCPLLRGTASVPGVIALLAATCYSSLGNFAAFFQIAAAARLDGYRGRIRLLPLNIVGFLVSLVCVSGATLSALLPGGRKRNQVWDKTQRFRKEAHR